MPNKKNRILLWGYLAVLFTCLLLSQAPFVDFLDNKLLDKQFRFVKAVAPRPVHDDLVVIGIEEATIDHYPEPLALWHPHLGKLFTGLARAAPSGVLLDIILPEKSYNFLVPGIDRILLSSLLKLTKNTQLVIARTVDEEGRIRPVFAPILSLLGEEHAGLALVRSDADGTVRKLSNKLVTDKGEFGTLIGKMAKLLDYPSTDGYIDYSLGETFDYIPMQQVDEWIRSENAKAMHAAFNQKVVMLGSVMPFVDRHRVPLPLTSTEPEEVDVPGIYIHAQALRSTLNQSTIIRIEPWLAIFALVLATGFWWIGYRFSVMVACLMTGVLCLLGVSTVMLYFGYWASMVGPLLAVVFAGTLRVSLESYYTWREKQLFKSSFSGYVSPAVLKNIIDGEIQQGLGGISDKVCVLFSDIRDFTSRSEGLEPQQVIDFLNRYFSAMTDVIHAHNGTVDKFMGDGIMAFFGAPNSLSNASESAFAAARQMLKRLEVLNQELSSEGVEDININIGLHYGDAIIGHVGSDTRHEYTVIGDTVNVASRLEGVAKQAGYPIVVSKEARINLGDDFTQLGYKTIKGHSPVMVYGWRGS